MRSDLIEQLKKNASIDISAKSYVNFFVLVRFDRIPNRRSISDTDITLPSETCEQIFESSNHFNDQFPFSATSQDYGHAHQWVESPCQPFFQDYSASIAPTVPSIFSPHSIVNDYAYTTSTIDDSSAPAFPWTFDSNSAVNFNKSLVICSRFDNFNPPCSQQHLPQDGPYANATDLNVLLATPKPCPMRQSA
jgi:hypothetical protein